MRSTRLSGPAPLQPWPSFVDALSASLLVLVFIITLLSIRSGKVLETMQKAKATDKVQQMITETVEKVVRSEGVTVTRLDERLRIMVPDTLLFSSGSAEISQEGQRIILAVARRLAAIVGPVEVQGHTDDRPIRGKLAGHFPTNWELSAARATAVVRLMEEEGGIKSERLSGAGLSMHRPVASNATEQGRARNRRIEIVVTPEAGAGE